MKDYKVLLYKTEGFGLAPEQAWLDCHGYHNIHLTRLDSDYHTFLKELEDAHALIIACTPITREVMKRMPCCEIIATHAIGINHVDLEAAVEFGICVANAPDYCIEDVATHTVALLLDCVRKVSRLNASVQRGEWNVYAGGPIHRIGGKTFGFVSFGNIPRHVVGLLRPFGLRFMAYDPYVDEGALERHGVTRSGSLEALFEECDFISVHTPLNETTYHMIGENILSHAKDRAVLLALGRGGVVDEAALKNVLECGKLGAAGIDVIEDEAGAFTALRGMENVVMTPHSAYYSEESIIEVREKALMQAAAVLLDKTPPIHLANTGVLKNPRFLSENPQIPCNKRTAMKL